MSKQEFLNSLLVAILESDNLDLSDVVSSCDLINGVQQHYRGDYDIDFVDGIPDEVSNAIRLELIEMIKNKSNRNYSEYHGLMVTVLISDIISDKEETGIFIIEPDKTYFRIECPDGKKVRYRLSNINRIHRM